MEISYSDFDNFRSKYNGQPGTDIEQKLLFLIGYNEANFGSNENVWISPFILENIEKNNLVEMVTEKILNEINNKRG